VKLHGAAGGRGYFLAWDRESFEEGARRLIDQKTIRGESDLYIQEFIRGVPVYLQYFYSPITEELELLGIDRRYESDIDGISRIPAKQQLGTGSIEPSYNVIGNIPLVLRESLLEEVYKMGENFVHAAERLVPPGMPGPFCLEGVYDSEGKFTTFEFSARIVAGTNLYLDGSPYSGLLYDEPMSMGRRIAREVKVAKKEGKLGKVIT
jgi:5-formaminoimidazole-4-carboxamide-1-(beta)-D-ribofuranosyl 5'-monophosphate synthetase